MTIEPKRYEIDEVFNLIGTEHLMGEKVSRQQKSNIIVDGFDVYAKSLRYMTFYKKGVECVCCGKKGTHFKLCGDEKTNRRHFNLYADDGTLMTKDHIVPKSKGGMDNIFNMQTMCVDCNKAKGSDCDEVKVECIVGYKEKTEKEIIFRSLEKAAYHIAQNYNHFNCKKIKKEEAVKIGIHSLIRLMNAIEHGSPYHGFVWTREWR